MKSRERTLLNAAFSSVGIYTEYFLGMLAAILMARHLGPADYGVYGLFMWFVSIGMVVTNSGITTGAIKFVAELRGSGREDLIVPAVARLKHTQHMHLGLAVALGVAAYMLLRQRLPVDMGLLEFLLLLVSMAMRALYMLNISTAKGFEAFGATAKVALVAAPLNLLMVIVAALLEGSIFWFIVVYAVSSAVFLAVSHQQVHRLMKDLPRGGQVPEDLRRRMRRHLQLVAATVIIGFFIASDVEILFLTMYDSTRSSGYFKVAYQLATGVTLLVPGVFGALLLPMMAKALSEGEQVAGRRFVAVTSYLALLAVPVMVFGVCFAGEVIGLLYGDKYATAAPVFAWIVFACGVGSITQGASSLLVSADRQQVILILTIIFGLLKVVLDMLLIEHFHLAGAVAAIVTVGLTGSITYVVIGMRVGHMQLDWNRLLRIAVAGVLAAMVAWPVRSLHWLPLWMTLLGGTLVVVSYCLFTLLLGCWSEGDLEQLQSLHRRFAGGRPRAVGQLLGWAGARAGRRE